MLRLAAGIIKVPSIASFHSCNTREFCNGKPSDTFTFSKSIAKIKPKGNELGHRSECTGCGPKPCPSCPSQGPGGLITGCPGSGPITKKWLLVKPFKGLVKETDFQECEEQLPDLEQGEFLARAAFWSVDPYMRAYAHDYTINDVMPGCQVAEVVKTRNNTYRKGIFVLGRYGWRTYTNINPKKIPSPILPDYGCLPISLALGYTGMTGNAAYFGMTEIMKPKKRHTVVVSGAGGAVGSHAGQLAKLKGSTVIGICGSKEKCAWITSDLNFDFAINYKSEDIRMKLKEYACHGVDMYWDNVGGCISSQVLNEMNNFGKVVVCGAISTYNHDFNWPPDAPTVQGYIYFKQLSLQGFLVNSFLDDWEVGIFKNREMIEREKLKYKEWIVEGFENIPRAFIGMMEGENIGKALVKNMPDEEDECDCTTHNKRLAKKDLESGDTRKPVKPKCSH